MSNQKQHLTHLDGLRAFAAVYVVLHHIVLQKYTVNASNLPIMEQITVSTFKYGHYAVNLFIVLSGYCLMLPVLNSNYELRSGGILTFYKKRTKRILPPYFLAMLVSLILIYFFVGTKTGTHWDMSIPVFKKDLFTHILLIHDLFHSTAFKINHAFWSISVEYRIYFLFPFLLIIWRKRGPLAAIAATAIISLLILIAVKLIYPYFVDIRPNAGVNPYVILFATGMFAADISYHDNRYVQLRQRMPWGIILLIMIMVVCFITMHPVGGEYGWEVTDILVGICSAVLLVAISVPSEKKAGRNWIKKVLSWKPLVFLGTFAYSIYLIHAPLVQILWQYVIVPLNISTYASTCLLLLVGTPVIIAMSYLFFLICERPFMSRQQKKATEKH